MEKYTGVLGYYFETGNEGASWVLERDGSTGYDAMVSIEKDDHLKVFSEDCTVLFDGFIEPDHKTGWTEYPLNPGNGQPSALGFWIHWTQIGWEPDEWAKMFMISSFNNGSQKPLRAWLTKAAR